MFHPLRLIGDRGFLGFFRLIDESPFPPEPDSWSFEEDEITPNSPDSDDDAFDVDEEYSDRELCRLALLTPIPERDSDERLCRVSLIHGRSRPAGG